MFSKLRRSLSLMLAVGVATLVLSGCASIEEGVEAGKTAAATVEHMATESDRLLGDMPTDEEGAKASVATALQEMVGQTDGNPVMVQAVLGVIVAKVQASDVQGKDAIVETLNGLEEKISSGEVEDVQGAVQEVVAQLTGGSDS